MANSKDPRRSRGGRGPALTRRGTLVGLGAAGLGLALPFARKAAAADVTLRWWSTQSAPAQLEAYKLQIAGFEAANPGIKVVFEPTSDEGYPAQLAAAFASKQLPDILTHLPSFAVSNYWANGLVEEFTDVINAIGPQNYYEGANRIYEMKPGVYAGTGIGNTAANMLWLRKDLMAKAGIDKAPGSWDELRAAAKKMQGGGIYGAPLPYGRNSMTSLIIIGIIHGAGGQIFSPDLQVAIDSDATAQALDFYKSMKELCPPGATNYSWGESLTAFVSGATATGIYAGRVLANVNVQNPGIADQVTCTTYPCISADVPAWTFNDFPSVFIPKGVAHLDASKKFAQYLFEPEGYIKQLHAAPGHILPVLKTIAENPKYLDNDIIKKYPKEVQLMAAAAAGGYNLGFESAEHQQNSKANDIIAADVLSEMVQRVVLNDEPSKAVLGDTAKKLEQIMKG
jgi:multiple sugar transport system substrate-binding protein